MKYIKFIVPLAMVFYLPLTFKSQDSTSIHDIFYKKQQQSLSLLSGWSVGNLIYSPLATNNLFSPESTNEYFHQMNFSWNLLNAGIAGLGHVIVNKDSKKPWDMKTLYEKKKIHRPHIRDRRHDMDWQKHQSTLLLSRPILPLCPQRP